MTTFSSTHSDHETDLTLVIDQGSHASRTALFSGSGELVYLASQDIATHSTTNANETTYEQDADEILRSIIHLLDNIPAELARRIGCAGLCTQRSTIVAWHKTHGTPLAPAISWRDTRSQPLINQLAASANQIRAISGLPLSAHYSAGKIHWLLNNNTDIQQAQANRQLRITPLASYLLFHLLREKPVIIDHSNAQRSQLFDIHNLNWSDELLQLFQIDSHILPQCAPVIHPYGHLHFNDIPLTCVVGDQNAVLSAYPPLKQNSALINIGTGAFILAPAEHTDETPQLLHTLANSNCQASHFVIEGTVNGAGAALSWAQQHDPCEQLFEQLPEWLEHTESPPIFINSVAGLGSPWWCDPGEPEFITIKNAKTEASQQAARYVAIIESMLFLIFNNIQQLKNPPQTLLISGGLSRLDTLCQKLADLTQANVQRFNEAEASARGCAWLANQHCKNSHLNWKALPVSRHFEPCDIDHEKRNILSRYQQFVGELNKRCPND